MFKLTLTPRKPRNPLVAASRMRKAGSHRKSIGTERQRLGREMQRELDRMKHPSP